MAIKHENCKKWYVYAIECEDNSIYIGQTSDLTNRWIKHVTGKGAYWTKRHKPLRLFHFKQVNTLKDALIKEREWKTTSGRRKLRKILSENSGSQAGEPAEELLKRILEEKAKLEGGKKKKKR